MILGGGIEADADWIYVSSHGTGSVYKMGRVDPNIMVQLVPNNYFKYPQDIVLVAPNTLLVCDLEGHAVYVTSVLMLYRCTCDNDKYNMYMYTTHTHIVIHNMCIHVACTCHV